MAWSWNGPQTKEEFDQEIKEKKDRLEYAKKSLQDAKKRNAEYKRRKVSMHVDEYNLECQISRLKSEIASLQERKKNAPSQAQLDRERAKEEKQRERSSSSSRSSSSRSSSSSYSSSSSSTPEEPEEKPKHPGVMDCLLAIIFPPLATTGQGCLVRLIILVFTCVYWIPGVLAAFFFLNRENETKLTWKELALCLLPPLAVYKLGKKPLIITIILTVVYYLPGVSAAFYYQSKAKNS